MLSTRQFAEIQGVHYRTALEWLIAGLVPGAEKHLNPCVSKDKQKFATYWLIPIESAKNFIRPSRRKNV